MESSSSKPSAKVVLDSISPNGDRLTTMEVKLHRFVLAELNTHRAFSRNSASSRAIPIKKQIERVMDDPAMPIEWGSNRPGMQAGEPFSGEFAEIARRMWIQAREDAVFHAEQLEAFGLHKQLVNRLLEPFMWHTVIISSTEWGNFWRQRCTHLSPLAQPEMRAAADAMFLAYMSSLPERLEWGEWHMPYLSDQERWCWSPDILQRVSAARCARVSYLTHDGKRDMNEDLALYEKLISATPRHASPLEHVATPAHEGSIPNNFTGWAQLRHMV